MFEFRPYPYSSSLKILWFYSLIIFVYFRHQTWKTWQVYLYLVPVVIDTVYTNTTIIVFQVLSPGHLQKEVRLCMAFVGKIFVDLERTC